MDIKKFELEYAVRNGRESLGVARETLARALQEVDHYIEKYEGSDDTAYKAQVLNWTINFLATFVSTNMRFDMLAQSQADLTRLCK